MNLQDSFKPSKYEESILNVKNNTKWQTRTRHEPTPWQQDFTALSQI